MKKIILLLLALQGFTLSAYSQDNENRNNRKANKEQRAEDIIQEDESVIVAASKNTTIEKWSGTFGGAKQFNTWSIGANAGILIPKFNARSADFNDVNKSLGYGFYVQKAFTHAFNFKLNLQGGQNLSGSYDQATDDRGNGYPGNPSFDTKYNWSSSITAQIDASALLYRRQTDLAVFVEGGWGMMSYRPDEANRTEQYFPVGVGMKFRVSNRIGLEAAYMVNFLDADNLDNTDYGLTDDRWTYTYIGMNVSLGPKDKKNLDWVNPYAIMYDELKKDDVRAMVESLKKEVKKHDEILLLASTDSDGDGVPDLFDQDPNTPPGVPVDGAGRAIIFPVVVEEVVYERGLPSEQNELVKSIQFLINSAKLQQKSQPAIKALAEYLVATNDKVIVKGYTSEEGSYGFNVKLSKDRANTVKKALEQYGVKPSNIMAIGYGPADPIASNDTPEGRAMNRRVEFVIQP